MELREVGDEIHPQVYQTMWYYEYDDVEYRRTYDTGSDMAPIIWEYRIKGDVNFSWICGDKFSFDSLESFHQNHGGDQ